MPRVILSLCLLSAVGCAGNHQSLHRNTYSSLQATTQSEDVGDLPLEASPAPTVISAEHSLAAKQPDLATAASARSKPGVRSTSFTATFTPTDATPAEPQSAEPQPAEPQGPIEPLGDADFNSARGSEPLARNAIQINLPSALAMIDGEHPAVGMAQWRVQEAYAQLSLAEALWLPSLQAGFSFHRHDGNLQTSSGSIVDINRNSFQYGLGTGAVGAGTTPRPGLVAQFHLADAIFQPEIAEKTAWARGHAAKAVVNERLLNAALAYIALIDAHQDAQILQDSQVRTAELFKITNDFAEAGEGLQADANRVQTELHLVNSRIVGARERMALASARLAQAISLDARGLLLPMDITVVPLDMVDPASELTSLIGTGLATRPELKESQALVSAACQAFQREKYAPFVPSVLLGFSTGGFGGGVGNTLGNVDSRYDMDALMAWEIRNLGLGEQASRRASSARVQQARFEKLSVLDQVAREITEAHAQVQFRREQMAITQRAIQAAQKSYDLNLARIRDGQGLPLEVLQSVQALEAARRAYLSAVVAHNQAQFQLQWSLGWPFAATHAPSTN